MVNAVAKVKALGVCENPAILDDGGNPEGFSRMDRAADRHRPEPRLIRRRLL
jgi:hypothetical protein